MTRKRLSTKNTTSKKRINVSIENIKTGELYEYKKINCIICKWIVNILFKEKNLSFTVVR